MNTHMHIDRTGTCVGMSRQHYQTDFYALSGMPQCNLEISSQRRTFECNICVYLLFHDWNWN